MLRRKTAHVLRGFRYMGRRSKQLLTVIADSIAMPAALWTAMVLKFGSLGHFNSGINVLYVASVLSTVPVFIRIGLYRAVVRFMGFRAALAIGFGVAVSTGVLLLLNLTVLNAQYPLEVFGIYFLLALLYVGSTRFGARELLRFSTATNERVIIYGAGAAGAQLCSALLTSG